MNIEFFCKLQIRNQAEIELFLVYNNWSLHKMIKFTPIHGDFDTSWFLKQLDKNTNKRKFTLIGSIHWINALAFLIREQQIDFSLFYQKIQKINLSKEKINNVLCSCLMSLDYLNTLARIKELENVDNLIRISIISWYYAIYNAAQSMIIATDGSCPQTHAKTAEVWNELLASRNLISFPFDYNLKSLVEKEYINEISIFESFDQYNNKKPADNSTARGMCCSYLKNTAKWYAEIHCERIKGLKEFKKLNRKDFKTKLSQNIRDDILRKKSISFLHQAFRYRGKSNYRDAPFISFGSSLYVNSSDFISDLHLTAENFIEMAMCYITKRIDQQTYKQFIKDLIENSNFSTLTKNFLGKF